MQTIEDHSEGRLVNQFCPENVILKFGGGGKGVPDMTFLNFLKLCQKLESVGLSVSDIVLESFPGSVTVQMQ